MKVYVTLFHCYIRHQHPKKYLQVHNLHFTDPLLELSRIEYENGQYNAVQYNKIQYNTIQKLNCTVESCHNQTAMYSLHSDYYKLLFSKILHINII